MSRSLFFGLAAAAAAFFVFRNSNVRSRKVPVQEAAMRLREAWAKNHTTA